MSEYMIAKSVRQLLSDERARMEANLPRMEMEFAAMQRVMAETRAYADELGRAIMGLDKLEKQQP